MYVYVYIYIYNYIYTHNDIYIYIYIIYFRWITFAPIRKSFALHWQLFVSDDIPRLRTLAVGLLPARALCHPGSGTLRHGSDYKPTWEHSLNDDKQN